MSRPTWGNAVPDPSLPYEPTPVYADDGLIPYYRRYLDAMDRPMTGICTLTSSTRPPADTTVEVVDGTASFRVKPGVYKVSATLRTADNLRAYDVDSVEIKG
jgi:hypothetical protein